MPKIGHINAPHVSPEHPSITAAIRKRELKALEKEEEKLDRNLEDSGSPISSPGHKTHVSKKINRTRKSQD